MRVPIFRTKNQDGDLERQLTKYARDVDETQRYTYVGTGSPNTVVTAPVGSIYHRLDGGAATSFYVKESGTGNTGWVGK
jgi:hypothetical protein